MANNKAFDKCWINFPNVKTVSVLVTSSITFQFEIGDPVNEGQQWRHTAGSPAFDENRWREKAALKRQNISQSPSDDDGIWATVTKVLHPHETGKVTIKLGAMRVWWQVGRCQRGGETCRLFGGGLGESHSLILLKWSFPIYSSYKQMFFENNNNIGLILVKAHTFPWGIHSVVYNYNF